MQGVSMSCTCITVVDSERFGRLFPCTVPAEYDRPLLRSCSVLVTSGFGYAVRTKAVKTQANA